MMFTSISYDSGWTVRVDGEKVDTFALGDGLLCFAVPEGEHTIEMSFCPTGLIAGIIISVLCVLILLVLVIPKLRAKAEELLDKMFGGKDEDAAAQRRARRQQRAAAEAAAETAEAVEEKAEEVRDYTAEGFEAVDLRDVFDEEVFKGYEEYYDDQEADKPAEVPEDLLPSDNGNLYFRRENRRKQ